MIRRLIVPLTLAALVLHAGQAFAQGVVPANDASPFPPVNGAAPSASIGGALAPLPSNGAMGDAMDTCMKGFAPLREEAEARGKLIKAASDRHASPGEACKLIGNFSQSEIKMIKYAQTNATKCGIPVQIAEQLKAGHKNTEVMQKKVCAIVQQAPTGPVGDFDHIGAPPLAR